MVWKSHKISASEVFNLLQLYLLYSSIIIVTLFAGSVNVHLASSRYSRNNVVTWKCGSVVFARNPPQTPARYYRYIPFSKCSKPSIFKNIIGIYFLPSWSIGSHTSSLGFPEEAEDIRENNPAKDGENEILNVDSQIEVTERC